MNPKLLEALRAHAAELRACAMAKMDRPSKPLVAAAKPLEDLIDEDQGEKVDGFTAMVDDDLDITYGDSAGPGKGKMWYIVYQDDVITKFYYPPGYKPPKREDDEDEEAPRDFH